MDSNPLNDLRAANQTITRFVTEVSAIRSSPDAQLATLRVDALAQQLNGVGGVLKSLPPKEERSGELETEVQSYIVNLRLAQTALEQLGPVLEEQLKVVKEKMARLEAAQGWSGAVKELER